MDRAPVRRAELDAKEGKLERSAQIHSRPAFRVRYATLKSKGRTWEAAKEILGDILGATFALVGLILVLARTDNGYVDVYLDIVGISLGFRGMLYARGSPADGASLVSKIADKLATWSLPLDIATVATTEYNFG